MSAKITLTPLPDNDDLLIRRADLPRYLPITRQTLAHWASRNYGPKFVKFGRLVAYRVRDVREWIEAQTRQNTTAAR